jgi:hypothetical protein
MFGWDDVNPIDGDALFLLELIFIDYFKRHCPLNDEHYNYIEQ